MRTSTSRLRRSAPLWGLAALLAATPALATYEVTSYTPSIPIDTPTPLTDDLSVTVSQPDTGSDEFAGVAWLWSRSSASLTSSDLNKENASSFDPLGGFFAPAAFSGGEAIITLDSSNFANDDAAGTDYGWYLHLLTNYLSGFTANYSSDTVIGPFNIDNVVEGSIAIVDPDTGASLTETRETRIGVQVGPPADVDGFYLGETTTQPSTTTDIPTNNIVTYDLTDTTTGSRTIYGWFTDQAGNTSQPVTASFTLLPPVSISPNTATIDVGGNQIFTVEGTSAGYDWTVSNETPVTSGDTVCQFTGTATNTNSATLEGVNPGTCVITATPNGGGTTLTSGTITVSGPSANLDVDGNGTATALGDGVLIVRYLFGFTGDTLINGVVDQACTRCTADDITTYLDGAKTTILDVDGNGTATALGDGVLVVRYLFGFTGDTLINGVVDQACTRCTASEITSELDKIKP